jgi:hypothetical protein
VVQVAVVQLNLVIRRLAVAQQIKVTQAVLE